MAWPSVSARTKNWGNEILTDSDLEGQYDIIHTYINSMMNASTGHGHTGSTSDGPKLNIAAALTIASQAAGDIIYASSSSVWARLAKGTDGQFLKLASGIPAWSAANTPLNYRQELNIAQASSTTLTIGLGEVSVNGTLLAKTSVTTLNLTTSGHWATTQKQQVSTYSFVGIDSSGNLMLGATAPTHSDYALSNTNGTKRYVSWTGGTNAGTYRIIGWFYMNATGSGELNAYEVANFKDVGVRNYISRTGTTSDTVNDTSYGNDMTETTFHFYSTGSPVNVIAAINITDSGNAALKSFETSFDASADTASEFITQFQNGVQDCMSFRYLKSLSQGSHTIQIQAQVFQNSMTITKKHVILEEE